MFGCTKHWRQVIIETLISAQHSQISCSLRSLHSHRKKFTVIFVQVEWIFFSFGVRMHTQVLRVSSTRYDVWRLSYAKTKQKIFIFVKHTKTKKIRLRLHSWQIDIWRFGEIWSTLATFWQDNINCCVIHIHHIKVN